MIPRFGTREWAEWKAKFVAECYEILTRNPQPIKPRMYDPVFARKPQS